MGRIGIDFYFFFVAAVLQLAAMFFVLRMLPEVNDRRPWLILFLPLLIMFVFRIVNLFVPTEHLQPFGPPISVIISFLLLVSLFSIRKIAVAERESKTMAARRTAERDESDRRYRSLVELSPDVIFVSTEGRIAYVNEAAVRFFGARSADDLLGRSPLNFTAPQSRALVDERINRSKTEHATAVTSEEWMRLDGTIVQVEAVAAAVPWQGGRAIQVILRDISERRRAEQEKAELLASERAARGSAERASRIKDEFLATLSHELRTPLNSILGWSQILQRSLHDPDDVNQGLETIERNARVQARLIDDLLDMSRIISGKLRLDIQKVNPMHAIRAAIETIQPSARAREVAVEQLLDPVAGVISGDSSRLQQIVWNLLSNAVKFTPKGGTVSVSLQRVESHIEISVADTGQGIDPRFLPYVFDRFRQADSSTTRRHGGLGLGLAIAKQLVELHGGSIWVSSGGINQGTKFVIELPLASVAAQAEVQPFETPEHAPVNGPLNHIDLSGLRVVVVDDEPDACSMIKRALDNCHAEVLIATTAEEGLSLVEKSRPHILVSDIGMPHVDGYEFLRRVRNLGAAKGGKVPAIALTAFARSEDRTRALIAGYSVHVAKPVEPRELIVTVASLAGRTGAELATHPVDSQ